VSYKSITCTFLFKKDKEPKCRTNKLQARAFSHFVPVYQELNACVTCCFSLLPKGYSSAKHASFETETQPIWSLIEMLCRNLQRVYLYWRFSQPKSMQKNDRGKRLYKAIGAYLKSQTVYKGAIVSVSTSVLSKT
jgi:hypothetical protein